MLLVAHRTPRSAAACARLAQAGATVFEVDVQLDRGRVVVSHYQSFGRTGLLQRDNWRMRPAVAAGRDPLLADIARGVPAGATVLLDVKQKAPDDRAALIDTLGATLPDRARYRVCGGMTAAELDRVRELGFRTWRTIGNASELAEVLDGGELPDEALSIRHTLLSAATVAQLHERVPTVVAWTVNRAGQARRLAEWGVDGLTTDRVDALAKISRPGIDRHGNSSR